jgi:hypothetical protein
MAGYSLNSPRQQVLSAGFFRFRRAYRDKYALDYDHGTAPQRRICGIYAGRLYDGRGGRVTGTHAEPVSEP